MRDWKRNANGRCVRRPAWCDSVGCPFALNAPDGARGAGGVSQVLARVAVPVGGGAVGVGEAVASREFPAGGCRAGIGHLAGVGGETGDGSPDVARGFGGGEVGVLGDGVALGVGGYAEAVEHGFGPKESRCQGDCRDPAGLELGGLGEGEADHRCLGEVVEQRAPIPGLLPWNISADR